MPKPTTLVRVITLLMFSGVTLWVIEKFNKVINTNSQTMTSPTAVFQAQIMFATFDGCKLTMLHLFQKQSCYTFSFLFSRI